MSFRDDFNRGVQKTVPYIVYFSPFVLGFALLFICTAIEPAWIFYVVLTVLSVAFFAWLIAQIGRMDDDF